MNLLTNLVNYCDNHAHNSIKNSLLQIIIRTDPDTGKKISTPDLTFNSEILDYKFNWVEQIGNVFIVPILSIPIESTNLQKISYVVNALFIAVFIVPMAVGLTFREIGRCCNVKRKILSEVMQKTETINKLLFDYNQYHTISSLEEIETLQLELLGRLRPKSPYKSERKIIYIDNLPTLNESQDGFIEASPYVVELIYEFCENTNPGATREQKEKWIENCKIKWNCLANELISVEKKDRKKLYDELDGLNSRELMDELKNKETPVFRDSITDLRAIFNSQIHLDQLKMLDWVYDCFEEFLEDIITREKESQEIQNAVDEFKEIRKKIFISNSE